ncbi:FAD-binding protein [Methylobacterium sp. E-045]|uniref:FAD-dependent oxidoreductase n=1 Tax=Methylobacterium sp. E-045 TaxID=2836575 RepID=UPI001FB8BC78|nr:FAD-binding oxidoreductase [Methylobacterium sp. E-045]
MLNDASRLNPTPVLRHLTLGGRGSTVLLETLRVELKAAAAEGRPVCASAARHSMGGQSIPRDGLAVTLTGDQPEVDSATLTCRVSAGTRWSQVIRRLDPLGLSPAVMQSNHDFAVGSTFCVNAHGWPAPHGPFGSTVRSLRLLLVDGTLVTCSPAENAELFGLAMGGYGLFGILIDLDIAVTPNLVLVPVVQRMEAGRFAQAFMEAVEGDPQTRMAYGRMSVARKSFFRDALLTVYRPLDKQPATLPAAVSGGFLNTVSRDIYRAQIGNETAKHARWLAETRLNPALGSGIATRNSLMNEPVSNLANTDMRRTDILHEYFVPPERFDDFLEACRAIIPKARAEFLNLTLRYVGADPVAVMAYAPSPRIAAVMSFSQEASPVGEVDMMQVTEQLIDRVVGLGGTFYLPYRLHARRDQIAAGYPRLAEFIAAKRRYDPGLLFRNAMWSTYFA